MITVTTYLPLSGEITSNISCQLETVALNIKEGHSFLYGDYPYAAYYIDVASKSPRLKGESPSTSHVFNYMTKQWELDEELAWATVKRQRAVLLSQTDWVVTKSIETNQSIHAVWLGYRQALRDITLQSDPLNLVWPVEP